MPGKKSSINKGFRSIFHIPEVKRGPTRERVTEMQVRAQKLPRSPEVELIKRQLEQAARLVFDKLKVNDDDGRRNSVTLAEGLCDTVKPLLEAAELLQSQVPITPPVELNKKQPMKGSGDVIKALKARVTAAELRIKTMSEPPKGQQRVLMPKDAWTVTGLNGQAGGVRLQIDSEVVDDARRQLLETQVSVFESTVTAALAYVDQARGIAFRLDGQNGVMPRARALQAQFERKKFPDVDKLPFVILLTKLEAAVHYVDLINPAGIKSMAEALEKMLSEAQTNTDAYVAQAVDGDKRERVEKKAYDDLVSGPLEQLRLLAEPLGLVSYGTCVLAAAKDKVLLMDLKRPCPPGEGARMGQLRKVEIDEGLRVATTEATDMRDLAGKLRDDLVKAVDAIKATRAMAVFTIDWKVIDAGLASVQALMPASNLPLGEVMGAVTSVRTLATQLKARVAAVDRQQTEAALFEKKVAELRTEMKAAVGDKGAIKLWDKASGQELTDRRHKLNKDLKTLTAEVALERLAEIRKDFDAKLAEVTPINQYADGIEADMQSWFVLYGLALSGMDGGGSPATPNAMNAALDAYTLACKQRPPVLAELQKAYQACKTAFKDLDKRSIVDIADDTHTQLAAEEKDKKAAEKALRDKLNARRYGLAGRAKLARKQVEGVKGDTTEIDRIDDQLKTAREQIKAGDEAGATRTMNIINNRIGLVQANPAGEPTRRRKELETLFQEWVGITTKAGQNLGEVVKLVDEYAGTLPGGAIAGRVTRLSKAIEDYSAAFATPPAQLRTAFELMADPATPEPGRRAAREQALAYVSDSLSRIQAHPLTTELARSPVPAARLVPGLLVRTLDRMNFTVSIAVE